jgi:hypothetical protein
MMVVAMLLSWKFCSHSNNLSTRVFICYREVKRIKRGLREKEWWKKKYLVRERCKQIFYP